MGIKFENCGYNKSMQLFIGIFIGIFIGANVGVIIAALIASKSKLK